MPKPAYDALSTAFQKTDDGKGVTFKTSYGPSGSQSKAVLGGQKVTITGTNLNGDTLSVNQQRPLFVARNTLRTPKIVQADLRYTRTFLTIRERIRPQIFAEANNLFNRSNFTTINTNAGTNAAGVITSVPTLVPTGTVLEARILQFGARIDF